MNAQGDSISVINKCPLYEDGWQCHSLGEGGGCRLAGRGDSGVPGARRPLAEGQAAPTSGGHINGG